MRGLCSAPSWCRNLGTAPSLLEVPKDPVVSTEPTVSWEQYRLNPTRRSHWLGNY